MEECLKIKRIFLLPWSKKKCTSSVFSHSCFVQNILRTIIRKSEIVHILLILIFLLCNSLVDFSIVSFNIIFSFVPLSYLFFPIHHLFISSQILGCNFWAWLLPFLINSSTSTFWSSMF